MTERFCGNTEAVALGYYLKRCSWKFRKIHRKTPVPVPFFKKNWPATLLKKRLSHKCFPVNFAKFLRAPFLKDHHWWLLLEIVSRKLFSQKNYHIFLRGL